MKCHIGIAVVFIYRMFSQEMLFIGNVLITALVSPQWSSTILNWCQQMQDTTIVGLVKAPLANHLKFN